MATAIVERFVPCQIDTQIDASKAAIEQYHQTWTPDIRLLTPDGSELYGWQGYLPPFEFLPQLLTGEGNAWLRLGALERASSVYEEVVARFPTSTAAPEAQYVLAVSRYKMSHEAEDLVAGWRRLQSRYPNSAWRQKQEFIEASSTS